MAAGSQRGASHVTRVPREFLENDRMSGPCLAGVWAGTASGLILAARIGAPAIAQEAGTPSATAATPSQAAAAAGAAAAQQPAAEGAPSATAATPSQAAAAAGAAA